MPSAAFNDADLCSLQYFLLKFYIFVTIYDVRGYREENIFMARLADQAERYEDMVNFMRNVADIGLCWLNTYTVDDG